MTSRVCPAAYAGQYVRALAENGSDTRYQIHEDMASHLPWVKSADSMNRARDQANRELVRMTARQPIRFTRVLLGWETGPCASAFLPGSVRQESDIRASDFLTKSLGGMAIRSTGQRSALYTPGEPGAMVSAMRMSLT